MRARKPGDSWSLAITRAGRKRDRSGRQERWCSLRPNINQPARRGPKPAASSRTRASIGRPRPMPSSAGQASALSPFRGIVDGFPEQILCVNPRRAGWRNIERLWRPTSQPEGWSRCWGKAAPSFGASTPWGHVPERVLGPFARTPEGRPGCRSITSAARPMRGRGVSQSTPAWGLHTVDVNMAAVRQPWSKAGFGARRRRPTVHLRPHGLHSRRKRARGDPESV